MPASQQDIALHAASKAQLLTYLNNDSSTCDAAVTDVQASGTSARQQPQVLVGRNLHPPQACAR
jgi:hypothetical protein